ncbi:hypothetical protein C0991_008216 [Blastosporella zonata]|nr:hypothetical protein C0991_008216 [Blastosporella zonata]
MRQFTLNFAEAGGVQWMCAGKGIIHAEMPVHNDGAPDPRGLQLWVDLPKQFKMVDPSYQELGPEQYYGLFYHSAPLIDAP